MTNLGGGGSSAVAHQGVPVWILDTGSSNHLVSLSSFPKRLRGAIEQSAHAVRLRSIFIFSNRKILN